MRGTVSESVLKPPGQAHKEYQMHLKTSDLQTPVSPQTFTHIGALDGVRALSILLVLVAHSVPFGPNHWGLNSMSGLMGMALFFCLSGFLIVSLLYRNADALTFLVRRILRIVPAVAVYVVIMVLLFGIGWRAVAENALFVTNYFYDGRGRGEVAAPMTHLWSLSVEMHFYLAIGLAAFMMGRRCVWLIPPAALAITFLRIDQSAYFNIATHLRVDEILSGGILALVTLHYGTSLRRLLSRQYVAIGALLVASVLLVLSCHEGGGHCGICALIVRHFLWVCLFTVALIRSTECWKATLQPISPASPMRFISTTR